jgi:hypothetical protein
MGKRNFKSETGFLSPLISMAYNNTSFKAKEMGEKRCSESDYPLSRKSKMEKLGKSPRSAGIQGRRVPR